jgi:WD40 repeat protein
MDSADSDSPIPPSMYTSSRQSRTSDPSPPSFPSSLLTMNATTMTNKSSHSLSTTQPQQSRTQLTAVSEQLSLLKQVMALPFDNNHTTSIPNVNANATITTNGSSPLTTTIAPSKRHVRKTSTSALLAAYAMTTGASLVPSLLPPPLPSSPPLVLPSSNLQSLPPKDDIPVTIETHVDKVDDDNTSSISSMEPVVRPKKKKGVVRRTRRRSSPPLASIPTVAVTLLPTPVVTTTAPPVAVIDVPPVVIPPTTSIGNSGRSSHSIAIATSHARSSSQTRGRSVANLVDPTLTSTPTTSSKTASSTLTKKASNTSGSSRGRAMSPTPAANLLRRARSPSHERASTSTSTTTAAPTSSSTSSASSVTNTNDAKERARLKRASNKAATSALLALLNKTQQSTATPPTSSPVTPMVATNEETKTRSSTKLVKKKSASTTNSSKKGTPRSMSNKGNNGNNNTGGSKPRSLKGTIRMSSPIVVPVVDELPSVAPSSMLDASIMNNASSKPISSTSAKKKLPTKSRTSSHKGSGNRTRSLKGSTSSPSTQTTDSDARKSSRSRSNTNNNHGRNTMDEKVEERKTAVATVTNDTRPSTMPTSRRGVAVPATYAPSSGRTTVPVTMIAGKARTTSNNNHGEDRKRSSIAATRPAPHPTSSSQLRRVSNVPISSGRPVPMIPSNTNERKSATPVVIPVVNPEQPLVAAASRTDEEKEEAEWMNMPLVFPSERKSVIVPPQTPTRDRMAMMESRAAAAAITARARASSISIRMTPRAPERADSVLVLPTQVLLLSLAWVDAKHMARVMCVCRTWCYIVDTDAAWKPAFLRRWPLSCAMSTSVLLPHLEEASPRPQPSSRSNGGPPSLIRSVSLTGTTPWKHRYSVRNVIESRWRRGHYTKRVLGRHEGAITALHLQSSMTSNLTNRHPRLASGSMDGIVKVWDANSERCLAVLETAAGETAPVLCVRAGPANIVVAGSTDKLLRVWHVTDDDDIMAAAVSEKKAVAPLAQLSGHDAAVKCVDINDQCCVTGSADGTLRCWDLGTGQVTQVFRGHQQGVFDLQVDLTNASSKLGHGVNGGGTGRRIISGSLDGEWRIWDRRSGQCTRVLHTTASQIEDEQLASATTPSVAATASSVCLQFDGSLLMTGTARHNNGCIQRWDLRTGRCQYRVDDALEYFQSMRFDQRYLILGGREKVVRVRDMTDITMPLVGDLPFRAFPPYFDADHLYWSSPFSRDIGILDFTCTDSL